MLADGSFELQSWTLGTESAFQGSAYETNPVNIIHGIRSLRLETSNVGPTSGFAEKDATDLTIGQEYQILFRYKSQNAVTAKPLRLKLSGTTLASLNQQQSSFVTVGPYSFVATATTHTVRFDVPQSAQAGLTIYWVDAVIFQEPESKLLKIARAINGLIESIDGIGGTGVGIAQHWATEPSKPAAYTYLMVDQQALRPTRSKSIDANFGVYTIIQSDQAFVDWTVLARKIQQLVELDPTLGGLTEEAYVSSHLPLNTAEVIAQGNHVSDIVITVRYRHTRGEP